MNLHTYMKFCCLIMCFWGICLTQISAQSTENDCQSINKPQYINDHSLPISKKVTNDIIVVGNERFFINRYERHTHISGKSVTLKPGSNNNNGFSAKPESEHGFYLAKIATDKFECPKAVVNASTLSGNAPLTVHFNAGNSFDPDGDIVFYKWNFGMGSSYTHTRQPTYTRIFSQPGRYKVVIKVEDNDEINGETFVYVDVKESNAKADFEIRGVSRSGNLGAVVDVISSQSSWRLYKPNGTVIAFSPGSSITNNYLTSKVLTETGTWQVEAEITFEYLTTFNNQIRRARTTLRSGKKSFNVVEGFKYKIGVRLETSPLGNGVFRPEIQTPTVASGSSSNRLAFSSTDGQNVPNHNVFASLKTYPNPFSTQTTLEFQLTEPAKISLFIRNAMGQVVEQLLWKEQKFAGNHRIQFHAKGLSSGLYFCVLNIGDQQYVKKMVLAR